MTGYLQPLERKQQVVNSDGTPTEYFIRWAQQRQIDIGEGITAQQALEIIEQYLADHTLQEGSGISLSPSGNISDSPTIAAEVQAILDQISTVQGSILFRGAAGWDELVPGTSGDFLKTNGAGANPEWAAAGGGGGSLLIATAAPTGTGTHTFSSIPNSYQNLHLKISGRSTVVAATEQVRMQLNGDTGANYNFRVENRLGASELAGQVSLHVGDIPGASATAGFASSVNLDIFNYLDVNQDMPTMGEFFVFIPGFLKESHMGLWTNPSAVTSVTIFLPAGNFAAGTRISLYGF